MTQYGVDPKHGCYCWLSGDSLMVRTSVNHTLEIPANRLDVLVRVLKHRASQAMAKATNPEHVRDDPLWQKDVVHWLRQGHAVTHCPPANGVKRELVKQSPDQKRDAAMAAILRVME